jgi:hypothetical protein
VLSCTYFDELILYIPDVVPGQLAPSGSSPGPEVWQCRFVRKRAERDLSFGCFTAVDRPAGFLTPAAAGHCTLQPNPVH